MKEKMIKGKNLEKKDLRGKSAADELGEKIGYWVPDPEDIQADVKEGGEGGVLDENEQQMY